MASLNISMPDDLRDFVDARSRQTHHATPTEYIRSLVREDQKRAQQETLECLLLEGIKSGKPVAVEDVDKYFDAKKAALLAKLKPKRRAVKK
jgi:antitoxin ParD1/3/4